VTPSVCAPQPDGSLASASRKVCGWPPARRESNPGGLTCEPPRAGDAPGSFRTDKRIW
jgi:hypothetical protein